MDLKKSKVNTDYDLICVGGGIMSATLALLAKIIDPKIKILILERLEDVALESSAAWNNAGTGHSALCELNYCPEEEDGSVSIDKAVNICSQFEVSKQFWSYLITENLMQNPKSFIHSVPHYSWVNGRENVAYLEKRYKTMKQHFMFDTIEFTKDLDKMSSWFPLIATGRTLNEATAASKVGRGTEVNFEVLTKKLYDILDKKFGIKVQFQREVSDIDPDEDVEWCAEVKDLQTNDVAYFDAKHVFIGAGGGSLLLLQKVEIEEKDGYGGFPVSGQWLVCNNESVINQHHAKVYSKAGPEDPPMSTPHLDTRFINGKKELLFGPFAGFSPKFLKEGSNLDLFKSITWDNIAPMLGAFWHNLPLTKYLVKQLAMSHEDRMDDLRKFVKDANSEDWELKIAGQRVQIIKKDEYERGILQFGTEIVNSKDGRITCLLGASPGASTGVHIMLEVLKTAFPELLVSEKAKLILKEMVPTWNSEVTRASFEKNLERTKEILEL